jgi:hypothetical protein
MELGRRAEQELSGKNLACWCPLDRPCHADVLLAVANKKSSRTKKERCAQQAFGVNTTEYDRVRPSAPHDQAQASGAPS